MEKVIENHDIFCNLKSTNPGPINGGVITPISCIWDFEKWQVNKGWSLNGDYVTDKKLIFHISRLEKMWKIISRFHLQIIKEKGLLSFLEVVEGTCQRRHWP